MKKLDTPIKDQQYGKFEYSATVGEFLDALDKNGYPWAIGDFFLPESNASCAVGQIGRNLGFDPLGDRTRFWSIDAALYRAQEGGRKGSLIGINDDSKTFDEVKERAHEIWDQYRDVEVMF